LSQELSDFRSEIDALDDKILELINKRLQVCLEVGNFKSLHGIAVRDSKREAELIDKLLENNKGPCPPDILEKIYRILIETAVSLENDQSN
tara:strand:- start:262 stop:534 length:273 start_codon:yes stop_codon:yes gene_type:complete